ncbi:MAG: hypothetical protein RID91_17820 [Azospirillaceae bacterium]
MAAMEHAAKSPFETVTGGLDLIPRDLGRDAAVLRDGLRDVAGDPVLARYRAYRDAWAQYAAINDDSLMADDPDRLGDSRILAEANAMLARQLLERTPPTTLTGLAVLLRHALGRTDDPDHAALLKSCLAMLLGVDPEAQLDDPEATPDDLPDSAFDLALLWGLDA